MINEIDISKIIIETYTDDLLQSLQSDVIIVGAGPSGLVCASQLAKQGYKVTVVEKRLSTGGGIWGGGMAMNRLVVQEEALPIIEEFDITYKQHNDGVYSLNSLELASSLTKHALRAGVVIFNLVFAEDVCIHNEAINGLVVNRTELAEKVPIDPIAFQTKVLVDATGHEAAVVEKLRLRNLLPLNEKFAYHEGVMNVAEAEKFVIENTQEIYPGLWICGMSVCHVMGGPRMGPIFGGMLLSGKRVAQLIHLKLQKFQHLIML